MDTYKAYNIEELSQLAEQRKAELDKIFEYDAKANYITINVRYPYHIELERISCFKALLQWTKHLCGKEWMTADLVGEFVKRVCEIKGWNINRPHF